MTEAPEFNSFIDPTDNSSAGTAPKKLKLTLKLNSSSSISSALPSSTTTSPSKPVVGSGELGVGVGGMIDLPTGLGNFKGRGRPKKAATTSNPSNITSQEDLTIKESTSITSKPIATATATTSTTAPTTSTSTTSSEYAADLKSFVSSMNTFNTRKWSLTRPLSLELKNLAGYEVSFPNGLWCTFTNELGSSILSNSVSNSHNNNINNNVSNVSNSNNISNNPTKSSTTPEESNFEITCQCGKLFNDRSKYRKHAKIHEKDKSKKTSGVGGGDEIINIEDNKITPTPTISLKLKLKPQ